MGHHITNEPLNVPGFVLEVEANKDFAWKLGRSGNPLRQGGSGFSLPPSFPLWEVVPWGSRDCGRGMCIPLKLLVCRGFDNELGYAPLSWLLEKSPAQGVWPAIFSWSAGPRVLCSLPLFCFLSFVIFVRTRKWRVNGLWSTDPTVLVMVCFCHFFCRGFLYLACLPFQNFFDFKIPPKNPSFWFSWDKMPANERDTQTRRNLLIGLLSPSAKRSSLCIEGAWKVGFPTNSERIFSKMSRVIFFLVCWWGFLWSHFWYHHFGKHNFFFQGSVPCWNVWVSRMLKCWNVCRVFFPSKKFTPGASCHNLVWGQGGWALGPKCGTNFELNNRFAYSRCWPMKIIGLLLFTGVPFSICHWYKWISSRRTSEAAAFPRFPM